VLTGADCRRRQNTDESFNGRFRDECLNMEWCNNGVSPQAGGMPVCMSNLATATNSLNAATNELNACQAANASLEAQVQALQQQVQDLQGQLASQTRHGMLRGRKDGREVRRVDGNPHC
jgi:hypothetical protein